MSGEDPTIPKQTENDREELLASCLGKLQAYYDDEILGTLIDLVQDNDDEYYQ